MCMISGTEVSFRRTAARVFCLAVMFWGVRIQAENLSTGFNLDFIQNTGDTARIRIYGGIPKKTAAATPLIEAFEQCHFEAVLGLTRELTEGARAYTRAVRGDSRPLLLSGNLAGGMHNGRWMEVAHLFDYQNTELAVHQLETGLGEFLKINTLNEAVGSTLFVMPSALSNAA